MITGYLVEFQRASGTHKAGTTAFISKDEYFIHKKAVRILRVYSETNKLIKK